MTTQDNSDFDRPPPDAEAREMLEQLGGNQMAELDRAVETGNRSRWWPFIVAGTLSFLWIVIATIFLFASGAFATANAGTFIMLVSGIITPVVIFWLIALVFQRTDPMLERRVAVAQTLHRAVAPVEHAEKRLAELQSRLVKELENVDAVAKLASERIGNLEARFQDQVSELFAAAADTEARTSTIRDSLGREREALAQLTDNVTGQFGSLDDRIRTLTGKIQETSDEAHGVAEAALERSTKQADGLKDAGQDLASRLDELVKRMEVRIAMTQETAEEVQSRLDQVDSRITESTGFLKDEMDNMSRHGDNISDILREHASGIARMSKVTADQAARVEENLLRQAEGVAKAAERAGSASTEVATRFEEQSRVMQETIDATVDGATGRLDEASIALERHARQAEAVSEEIHSRAMEQTRATAEAVWQRADEINDLLGESMRRAADLLEQGAGRINEFAQAAEERTGQTAERALSQLRQLQGGIDSQMHVLEDAAGRSQEQLAEIARQLEADALRLAEQATEAKRELETTGQAMDERMIFMSQSLQDMRSKVSHLESDLTQQQETLEATSRKASDTVIEAAELFKSEIHSLREAGDNTSETLTIQTSELRQNISDLGSRGEGVRASLDKTSKSVRREAEDLHMRVEEVSRMTGEAAANLGKEREALMEGTGEVIDGLKSASETMAGEIHKLNRSSHQAKITVENAAGDLEGAASRTRDILENAVERTAISVTDSLSGMQSQAMDRLSGLKEGFQELLIGLVEEYGHASDLAGKQSELLANRIRSESDRLARESGRFVDQTAEIEERLAVATRDDFTRTSQLLLESLQSLSIDLNKMLDHDVPDNAWAEYMKGDRSFFARRTIRMGSKAARKAIAARYEDDGEFREIVSRYTRDFESLMERAMLGDRGSAMSVTLISSDMGKLYVLLAQSTNKLS